MRAPACIKLFSLTRTEADAGSLGLCGTGASTHGRLYLRWETRRSAEGGRKKRKSRGLGEPPGLPVGNLSSRRQTLLSKVREPKNLLEKTQLSGDKIGATVLAVCSVTC